MNDEHPSEPLADAGTALLLTGGGARAAYQVGVLQGIAALQRRWRPEQHATPFGIIVGTSAGAINAAALACEADQFRIGVARLARIWSQFHVEQVYHASFGHTVKAGLRWMAMLLLGWMRRSGATQPRSLLDNAPLRELLSAELPMGRIPDLLARGYLRALAVTTSSYTSGEHVTFFDGPTDMADWTRARRHAMRTSIGIDHLMASAALPFLFPATRLIAEGRPGYYGDGSMRQVAPISPVIHLGARRVLIVGVGRAPEPPDVQQGMDPGYPSLAQVADHALSSIFLDALASDVERLQRVNHTISLIDPAQRIASNLRPIQLLVITPSERLDRIAARHTAGLPRTVRGLLRMLGMRSGALGARSSALAAYLLFEGSYTRALMRLGRQDALAKSADIARFFGWNSGP